MTAYEIIILIAALMIILSFIIGSFIAFYDAIKYYKSEQKNTTDTDERKRMAQEYKELAVDMLNELFCEENRGSLQPSDAEYEIYIIQRWQVDEVVKKYSLIYEEKQNDI